MTAALAITPERIRACATIAVARDLERGRAAGRDVHVHAEQRAHKDDIPLTDADWAAVYQLVHGELDFSSHTGPAAPRQSGARRHSQAGREERQTNSRLRATYDAERWLAINILSHHLGGPTIAEHLGIPERAVFRWRERRALGWPTDVDAALLPTGGVFRTQGVTDTRAIGRRTA